MSTTSNPEMDLNSYQYLTNKYFISVPCKTQKYKHKLLQHTPWYLKHRLGQVDDTVLPRRVINLL